VYELDKLRTHGPRPVPIAALSRDTLKTSTNERRTVNASRFRSHFDVVVAIAVFFIIVQ
jgi:hypothetical protein